MPTPYYGGDDSGACKLECPTVGSFCPMEPPRKSTQFVVTRIWGSLIIIHRFLWSSRFILDTCCCTAFELICFSPLGRRESVAQMYDESFSNQLMVCNLPRW